MWETTKELLSNLPAIMSALKGNEYGLIAFIALVIFALALVFFYKDFSGYRLGAFILILLGGALLVYGLMPRSSSIPSTQPTAPSERQPGISKPETDQKDVRNSLDQRDTSGKKPGAFTETRKSVFADGFLNPTGLAIHPIDHSLYVKSGTTGRVWTVPIRNDGAAGSVTLRSDSFTPDLAIVCDAAGNLYGLENGTQNVYCLSTSGSIRKSQLRSNDLRQFTTGIAIENPSLPSSKIFISGHEWHRAYYLGGVSINELVDSSNLHSLGHTWGEFRFLYYRKGTGGLIGSFKTAVVAINPADGSCTTILEGLVHPNGISGDKDGTLYIADTGAGTIIKVTPLGHSSVLISGLDSPTGLAYDAKTNLLFVSETTSGRITTVRINP